jgi:hypothetical protein
MPRTWRGPFNEPRNNLSPSSATYTLGLPSAVTRRGLVEQSSVRNWGGQMESRSESICSGDPLPASTSGAGATQSGVLCVGIRPAREPSPDIIAGRDSSIPRFTFDAPLTIRVS